MLEFTQSKLANDMLSLKSWIQLKLLRLRIGYIDNWNYRYLQFELLITTIGFVDIDSSNCGYCWYYRQCDLSIWTIRIADISNSNCESWHCDLSISTMCFADIDNLNCGFHNAIYRYWQFVLLQRKLKLWIWTMLFVDIDNSKCWHREFELWISAMRFVDINNVSISNCWYRQ